MNKELFLKALQTLFYSWGGDTPPEAYWAGNEFIDYFETVNNIQLGIRFEEPWDQNNWEGNYDAVIEVINKL